MKHRIIIDTDCGSGIPGADIDDALAISIALRSPDIELVGITTMTANVGVEEVTASTLQLLEIAGANVPVCMGARSPLVTDQPVIRQRVRDRGESDLAKKLWKNVPKPAPTTKPDPRNAVEFIIETVMANPGEISLIPIGSFTNIALALKTEPELAKNIKSIVFMGGSIRAAHGVLAPTVEFNAGYDPEATQIMFQSGVPITMVGLDVTTKAYLYLDDLKILGEMGTPLTDYLAIACEPWLRLQMEWRKLPGCWLHDPLAVCVLLDPSLVTTEPMHVDVELTSPYYRGRTNGWNPVFPYVLGQREANAQVCMDVDVEKFKKTMFDTLRIK